MSKLYLSYSKIGRFKRCRQKYWWHDVERIRPKQRPAPPRMGTMAHEGVAAFLKGEDWKAAIADCFQKEIKGMPLEAIDYGEADLVTEVLDRWIKQFRYFRSPDEKLFRAPEAKFEVIIPTPNGTSTHTTLIGYWDLVINIPGEGLWIVDHKFTTGSLDGIFQNLELDEQWDYYLWALHQMYGERYKIMGAIHNGIRLKLPGKPAVLKDGTRLSQAKIETDYETYMEAILESGFDPSDYQEMLNRLKLEPNRFNQTEWTYRSPEEIKQAGEELYWIAREVREAKYPTRTRSVGRCSWDCPYKSLCICKWKGGDLESLIELDYERKIDETEPKEEEEPTKELPW